MTKQHKFKTKLLGVKGMETAALRPPFDVPKTFGRKGRVPIKGTINGFPFRSSFMNMGDGHMMVVNRQMREGAKVKAGNVVSIVIELDEDKRTVDVPTWLKRIIQADAKAKAAWPKLSITHQKEYVHGIAEAKREETRDKRVAQMMRNLRTGTRKA